MRMPFCAGRFLSVAPSEDTEPVVNRLFALSKTELSITGWRDEQFIQHEDKKKPNGYARDPKPVIKNGDAGE